MKIFITLLVLVLSACTTKNIARYQSVDQTQKTITVPSGSSGLRGKIKKYLSQNGWKMVVYEGPSITKGVIGKKTELQSYDTFNTRYRLLVNSGFADWCLDLTEMVWFDLSLIDNKSGTEVLTMDGEDCQDSIAKEFINLLN